MSKIVVSMSGGKTSAYMSKFLRDECGYDVINVFCNTGQEHDETLEFIDKCDRYFDFNTIWLESVVHEERRGTSYKEVDFDTASRDGQPFKDVCEKYGVPNAAYPHCNRELKLAPFNAYIKDHNLSDLSVAIGIRADEMRRVISKDKRGKIVYPLAEEYPTDKRTIIDWWEDQDFNLNIPAYLGNCKWCWKKTDSKHYRIIKEYPEIYEFTAMLEAVYGESGNGSDIRDNGKRVMFRKNRSTHDLIKEAELMSYEHLVKMVDATEPSSCTESCEPFQCSLDITEPL